MSSAELSVFAVGDVAPTWISPEPLFAPATPTLRQADILFGNMEVPVCEAHEIQLFNRSDRRMGPNRVAELTAAGFHVMSFANNHALDSGERGLLETVDTLTKHNIAVIGAGRNIVDARKPAIFERKGVKIAFLAYCSVLPKGYEATNTKCGCVPMRASTFYEQIDWQPGTDPKIVTLANRDDLAAMVADVGKVRPLVDIVIMSIHWGVHLTPGVIAMYQQEVGHAAIDAGVDLILGHHAHILKGIEVYKGKVIFHSLGNFITQSRKGLNERKVQSGVSTEPHYPHFGFPADSRKTMIAKCIISDRKIRRVSVCPVLINRMLQPEPVSRQHPGFDDVLSYMKNTTERAGLNAEYRIDGDEVVIDA